MRQHPTSERLSSESGIAIGVILFGLALIAVVTIAMTSGSNTMGSSTITIDRINADIKSQADLIATKIRQCYTTAINDELSSCENNTFSAGVWSRPGCNTIDRTTYYPAGASPGVLVSAVTCPGFNSTDGTNLWTGKFPSMLPPVSSGLNPWYYVNAGDSGGRCIRIQPLVASASDATVKAGIAQATNAYSANEAVYSAGSTSQRFIYWITRPSGAASADCSP